MTDDTEGPGGLGHNSGIDPAPFDAAVHLEHKRKAQEWSDAAGAWLDKGKLETEEDVKKVKELIDGAKIIETNIAKAAAEAKKPHEDRLAATRAAYSVLTETFAGIIKKLKPMLEEYRKDLEAKLIAKKAEEQRLVEAKVAAAEQELQRARDSNDTMGEKAAEKALKALGKEVKAAAKPVKATVGSGIGSGRAIGAPRKQRYVEVTNFDLAYYEVRDNPGVKSAIEAALNGLVRAKDWDNRRLRGVTVKEREIF